MISSNQINHLIAVLETGHAKAEPGWPIQAILGDVLINMAERIVALEKANSFAPLDLKAKMFSRDQVRAIISCIEKDRKRR